MKLSEAIRLGSMLRPQAFGDAFRDGGSCAFGAAIEACGIGVKVPVKTIWTWLAEPRQCHICGEWESATASIISVHLNDRHRWTREQIADWVASVEPQEKAADNGLTLGDSVEAELSRK